MAINKFMGIILLSSVLFCNYSFAQSNKPTTFKNGIQGNSNVIDSDGNNLGNLSSLISTANNAIPKSQIGVANGVAPLDSNSMMSSAVSGDVTNGTILEYNRTLYNIFQDFYDLKNNGIKLDGSDTTESINSAISGSSGIVYIPNGQWPSSSFIPNAPSSRLVIYDNVSNFPQFINNEYNEGIRVPYFGTGVTSVGFEDWNNNGLKVNRVDDTTYTLGQGINASFNYVANNSNGGSTWNSGHQNITSNEWIRENNWGYTNNLSVNTSVYSANGAANFDVGIFAKLSNKGEDWIWGEINEIDDTSQLWCNAPDMLDQNTGSPKCMTYLYEWDLNGYGKEAYDISWKTAFQSRNTVSIGYTLEKPTGWIANTSYKKHQMILVSSGNIDYIYENESGGDCVSDGTIPTFALNETSVIKDGTCSWSFQGKGRYEIATTFSVGGGAPYSYLGNFLYIDHGPKISNTVFDLSATTWDENSTIHSWVRTEPDSYWDMSDDYDSMSNSTDHGHNRHILGYSSTDSSLEYIVSGTKTLQLADDGTLSLGNLTIYSNSANNTSSMFFGGDYAASRFNPTGSFVVTSGQVTPSSNRTNTMTWNTFNNGSETSGYSWMMSTPAVSIQEFMALRPDGLKLNTNMTVSGETSLDNANITTDGSGNINISGNILVGKNLYLGKMTKTEILALTSPIEGQKIFDSDDHEEVTYRCPSTGSCGWFPVQYGTALSN